MDISVFTNLLHSEFIKNSIPKDKADRYIQTLQKSLSPEDIADMTEADVARFAKLCRAQIQKSEAAVNTAETVTDTPDDAETVTDTSDDDEEIIISDVIVETGEDDTESVTNAPASAEKPVSQPIKAKTAEAVITYGKPVKPQSIPKKNTSKFVLITVFASPLWLACAVIAASPFILMFALELALTAALVCLLASFAAIGTAASLTGIVYGIVKMFSVPAVGLYEIGFGIIIAGVTMICGILIYNGTVRFMPWLLRKSCLLVKLTISKIKPLLSEYKRRCESL